jgi:hypothetical protein
VSDEPGAIDPELTAADAPPEPAPAPEPLISRGLVVMGVIAAVLGAALTAFLTMGGLSGPAEPRVHPGATTAPFEPADGRLNAPGTPGGPAPSCPAMDVQV